MRFLAGLFVVGLMLSVAGPAGASSAGWSDNFNGPSGFEAQQTWLPAGSGLSFYDSGRLVMSTDSAYARYVNESFTDVVMQTRIQAVLGGGSDDHFLAYLLARGDVTNMTGYLLGVGSPGGGGVPHLWLGKLTAGGVYSDLAWLSTQPSFDWTDCQAKFEVAGNTLRGKVWSTGSAEPGWQIQTTDSSYAGGVGGLMLATYPPLGWDTTWVAFDDVNLAGAVPEPLTMAGLMLGIGGLVGYVRKRRMA